MGMDVPERPVDIGVDVGREAEQRAGLEDTGEAVEIGLVHEAALPVLLLRPWIRIEKVDAVEAGVGQPVEQLRGIVIVEADIGDARPPPQRGISPSN
jgi:hypothetical protein